MTASPSAPSPTPPPSPTSRPSPAAPAPTPSRSAPRSPPAWRSIWRRQPTSLPSPLAATPEPSRTPTTLIGGTGADTITLGAVATNASIDLGAGNDTLTFGNFTNSATVANTETITGGTGADTVTLGTALTTAMSVDLGTGANKLTLADGGNTGTVSNVQTLTGGSGADSVTLGRALVNGSVDLGAGSDTLQLANFTNRVSIANTETILGGSGNDTLVLTGSNASMVVGGGGMDFITGNSGADECVLDQSTGTDYGTILNFSAAKGDKIALDTTGSSIRTNNTYRPWRGCPEFHEPDGRSRCGNAPHHRGGNRWAGRVCLPAGYRRAVLQRQRKLRWWRQADRCCRQQQRHLMGLCQGEFCRGLTRRWDEDVGSGGDAKCKTNGSSRHGLCACL